MRVEIDAETLAAGQVPEDIREAARQRVEHEKEMERLQERRRREDNVREFLGGLSTQELQGVATDPNDPSVDTGELLMRLQVPWEEFPDGFTKADLRESARQTLQHRQQQEQQEARAPEGSGGKAFPATRMVKGLVGSLRSFQERGRR